MIVALKVVCAWGKNPQNYELEGENLNIRLSPDLAKEGVGLEGNRLTVDGSEAVVLLIENDPVFGEVRVVSAQDKTALERVSSTFRNDPSVTEWQEAFGKQVESFLDALPNPGATVGMLHSLLEEANWVVIGLEVLSVFRQQYPEIWSRVEAQLDEKTLASLRDLEAAELI